MNAPANADTLHRLVKQVLDSGTASSIAEAEALFRGYQVCFSIDGADAACRHHQAALLTGIALAKRVFLGGVFVTGELSVPLHAPLPLGSTLREAAERLGADVANAPSMETPHIFIGGNPRPRAAGFGVRAVFAGWRGGVMPAHASHFQTGEPTMVLAPMLASALAVSEAFFSVQGCTPAAGRRMIGLSLWQPDKEHWLAPEADALVVSILPSQLWLIGLGHLGQAFLWALSLLPYRNPAELSLTLQDVDSITDSTWSTSILSETSMAGLKKTRAMAQWAEQRGFVTAITERLFDPTFRRAETDPAIALCGLDNALGRLALGDAGFPLVIEAGLGRDHRNFHTMRLHTLPASRPVADIWGGADAILEDLLIKPAYERILSDGELDHCGVTLLAGKAVGAPFVGAVAASLVIAEVLRFLHGGPLSQLIDLNLRSPDDRTVIRQPRDFSGLNPGYALAE
jgi:hypothetical protein